MSGWLLLLLTPVAFLIGSLVGTRRFGLCWREDIGLQWPSWRAALIAAALFLLLSLATEALYDYWRLGGDEARWRDRYPPAALVARAALMVLVYPLVEELFFRGFVFAAIRRRAGEIAAITGSAVFFALLHAQYDWRGMLLILIDALFFGMVRSRTGSVLLTMGLHIAGNGYAFWERL